MPTPRLSNARVTVGLGVLCTLALAGLLALVLPHARAARPAVVAGGVRLIDDVPIGVLDTRAGALAAADNYVALASQSVEQDPHAFTRLVQLAFLPGDRAAALAEARALRARDRDRAGIANYRVGGRALAVIAARRLDSYTRRRATVTTWLGGFVWGPRIAPRQSWNLVDTTLDWHAGRWMIASSSTDSTPAPVPSIVYVQGHNDQSSAFARLVGMSAPFYGTGG